MNTGYVTFRLAGATTLNLAGGLTITANANAIQNIFLPTTNLVGSAAVSATAASAAPTTVTFAELNRATNRGTFILTGTSLGLTPSPAGNSRVFATLIDGAAPASALLNLAVSSTSAGIVELDGVNTYTGGTVFLVSLSQPLVLSIKGDESLGNGPGIEINATANAPILLRGNWDTSKILRMNANTYPINTNGFNAQFDGPIVSNGFVKTGSGTATLTYPNVVTAGFSINGGDLVLANRGSIAGGTQTLGFGTRLILDNTGTHFPDRIGDATNVTSNNGEFRYLGSNLAINEEIIGNLTLGLASTVTLIPGEASGAFAPLGLVIPAEPAILRVNGTFARSNNSGILFRGKKLGTDVPGTPDVTNIMLTFPLNSLSQLTGGGGAAGSTAISIIAGAFCDTNSDGQGTQMVTYDLNRGVRLMTTAEFISNPANLNGRAVSDNIRVSTGLALANNSSMNSLWVDSSSVSGAGNVTLTSGILLATGTGNVIDSPLVTPTNFALSICVTSGSTLAINSILATLPGGIIKRGEGRLTLGVNNTFTGTTTLAAGTLVLGATASLGNTANSFRILGGTLQAGSAGSIINNTFLSGDMTFSGSNDLTFTGSFTIESATRTISIAAGRTLQINVLTTATAGVGLTKSGPGTLLLATNATAYGPVTNNFFYLATTTVDGGTLRVTNTLGSATGSTRVFVKPGGTLDGTGFIAPAQTRTDRNLVVVEGTLRPGIGSAGQIGVGSATDNATMSMEAGSTFAFNSVGAVTGGVAQNSGGSATIVTGNNHLLVTGSLTIDPLMNTAIAGTMSNFDPMQVYSFRIANSSSMNSVLIFNQAQFDTSGFVGYNNEYFFNVSSGVNSLYLNFVPVPEPLLLVLAAAGVLAVRRRNSA